MNNGQMDRGNENPTQHLPWWLRETTKKPQSCWPAPGFKPGTSRMLVSCVTAEPPRSVKTLLLHCKKEKKKPLEQRFLFAPVNKVGLLLKDKSKGVTEHLTTQWIKCCKISTIPPIKKESCCSTAPYTHLFIVPSLRVSYKDPCIPIFYGFSWPVMGIYLNFEVS